MSDSNKFNIDEFFNSNSFDYFCDVLFSMKTKTYDRDNTILLSLKYDSFQDFFDSNKNLFIVTYSTDEKLFKAIFRIFISHQLSCITDDKDNEAKLKASNFIDDLVNNKINNFIDLVKKHHSNSYDEIILINKNKSFF